MNFSKKVVWITGASSGIGEALAYAFAKEGAILILSARREKELNRVRVTCLKDAEDCFILPLDLMESEKMEELAKDVIARTKRIDILVNNGGISQRSLTRETPLLVDRKIMEVNYFGTVALTKAVLPYMIAQKDGHIVNISSMVGKFGFELRSAYAASKHALHGFFDSLLIEETKRNSNIRVTMVCPGRINTNISFSALSKTGQPEGVLDNWQANGLSADKCAATILNGIVKNKRDIYIGFKENLLRRIRFLVPSLFFKIATNVKAR